MDLTKKHCIPCEVGGPALTDVEEDILMKNVPSWTLVREKPHKLRREFTFKDFKQAMVFINKVAGIAEAEGHHPDIYVFYNKVKLEFYTHAVNGLSENDFIMAAKIDAIV